MENGKLFAGNRDQERNMLAGSYGKEPFDLWLTVLRMIRNLGKIVIFTLAGTLLFGGGYYVKNVLLRQETFYEVTSVYKVSYVDEPSKSGDYYINEMTWNTYVQSKEFLDAVFGHLEEKTRMYDAVFVNSPEQLGDMIQAKLDSDVHVPSTVVTAVSPDWAVLIAESVEETMTGEFAESNEQVAAITVIDPGAEALEVIPDVRPVRAFVLSAVLSCFFTVVILLLRELGDDCIWLPATLRQRYGLSVVGTVNSPQAKENLEHVFEGRESIAICTVDEHADPREVIRSLKEKGLIKDCKQWIPVPAPTLCPEAAEPLRSADGVLLVVRAGRHAGKTLEYTLEYFAAQDISVTAALLWEADESLIREYYFLGKGMV